MAIHDLFSKRQKRLRGEVPDVYQYDDVPPELRVQIVQIMREAIGDDRDFSSYATVTMSDIHTILCKEYGRFHLHDEGLSQKSDVISFFIHCTDFEKALDVIELWFKSIALIEIDAEKRTTVDCPKCAPEEAIADLNTRFKEHGVGYQFESNQIIRVDSQFLHTETVKPALSLMASEERFRGANEEFLKAHEHYRAGRHKECLADALKAFESMMKAICDKQGWKYDPKKGTAKNLIDTCYDNKLIPDYMQAQFGSLRGLLESGVPTIRNHLAGHGQGTETVEVDESVASYALHLTASNILFLAKLEKRNFG